MKWTMHMIVITFAIIAGIGLSSSSRIGPDHSGFQSGIPHPTVSEGKGKSSNPPVKRDGDSQTRTGPTTAGAGTLALIG